MLLFLLFSSVTQTIFHKISNRFEIAFRIYSPGIIMIGFFYNEFWFKFSVGSFVEEFCHLFRRHQLILHWKNEMNGHLYFTNSFNAGPVVFEKEGNHESEFGEYNINHRRNRSKGVFQNNTRQFVLRSQLGGTVYRHSPSQTSSVKENLLSINILSVKQVL